MQMDPRDSEYVQRFEESLLTWQDQRFISQDQIRALAMFGLYLVNLAEHQEWSYYGHSYKVGKPMSILVMKAIINDAPVVCFTSARTFCGCVRVFLRKLEMDMVEWREDQYRQ